MRLSVSSLLLAATLVVSGCGSAGSGRSGTKSDGGAGGGGGGSGGGTGGGGGGDSSPDMAVATPGSDFPAAPIIDGTTPTTAPGLFGAAGSGSATGGPCLTQPPIGALLPQNFLRPRFDMTPVGNQNIFEIRIHTAGEVNDLLVYTQSKSWAMPQTMWQGLSTHTDQPVTVTIRGAVLTGSALTAGPSLGSTGDLTIAPASAPGAIVYWAEQTGTLNTSMKGFNFGDDSTPKVVMTQSQSPGGQTGCIACHASTPDGLYIGLAWTSTNQDGRPAQIGLFSTDGNATVPSFITASAAVQADLAFNGSTMPVFSKAHWTTGDRLMVSLKPTGPMVNSDFPGYSMISTNLETGAQTNIATGEATGKFPGAPAFSHDGMTIVYASGSSSGSGYQMTDGDLRKVAFTNGAGGTSVALGGAANSGRNEYFPSFSPDDKYIAFTAMPVGNNNYTPANAPAEISIVNADGSSTIPTRLAANDPAACTGVASPGLTNSWPKWAPDTTTVGTRTFYWLTFSSKRNDLSTPQLFVTPVVIDSGVMKTYPALYLWNQLTTEGNHTPAWDNFQIPIS